MTRPFLDRCIFNAASAGTGDFAVSSAATGYQLPSAAGAVNNQYLHYAAQNTALTEWEVGIGLYTTGGPTLTRQTVLYNSLGTTAKINFSAAPSVLISALARDFGRVTLTAATSYYVSTSTGSDTTGDGSSTRPWQTLVYANSFLRDTIDFNGFRVDLILQTADTYIGFVEGGGYVGGGILSIHGATNAPASYIVVDNGTPAGAVFRLIYDTSTRIRFDQMTFKTLTQYTDMLWVDCRANVVVAGNFSDGLGRTVNMDYSADVSPHANGWTVDSGGYLNIFGTCNVTVPATNKIGNLYLSSGLDNNNTGGSTLNGATTFNFSGNLRMNQFAYADSFSIIASSDTFNFVSGAPISGARYYAEYGGTIITLAGESYFPGTTIGTLATGAQYI